MNEPASDGLMRVSVSDALDALRSAYRSVPRYLLTEPGVGHRLKD